MSLGRTGRTNHAKGGRPPKRRTVVIHDGEPLGQGERTIGGGDRDSHGGQRS